MTDIYELGCLVLFFIQQFYGTDASVAIPLAPNPSIECYNVYHHQVAVQIDHVHCSAWKQ